MWLYCVRSQGTCDFCGATVEIICAPTAAPTTATPTTVPTTATPTTATPTILGCAITPDVNGHVNITSSWTAGRVFQATHSMAALR